MIGTMLFWKHAILITLVGSAESTLSVCAVDKIDPANKRSDLNLSLFGNGLANFVNGCIGGLPVITEIVRSSANVSNGAKTQWSNFSHGMILIAFLMLAPSLLHEIPVSALAAVLIVVGFRLAAPRHFVEAFKHGQGLVFVSTVLAILMTDLLTGVLVGTFVEFIKVFTAGKTWKLFRLSYEESEEKEERVVAINGPLAFTNYLRLREHLNPNAKGQRLTLDLSRASVVDHTVNEHLSQHTSDYAAKGKSLVIRRGGDEVRYN
jgi:MFS superfamily sulfate permease-like transporter